MDAAAEAVLAESDCIFTVKEDQRTALKVFFIFIFCYTPNGFSKSSPWGGDVPQCHPVTPAESLEL